MDILGAANSVIGYGLGLVTHNPLASIAFTAVMTYFGKNKIQDQIDKVKGLIFVRLLRALNSMMDVIDKFPDPVRSMTVAYLKELLAKAELVVEGKDSEVPELKQ